MQLNIAVEAWPLRSPFKVAGHQIVDAEVVVIRLERDGRVGLGEAVPIWYKGESCDSMAALAAEAPARLGDIWTRERLIDVFPACSARCGLDAALWSLEAAEAGVPVSALLGRRVAEPVQTAFTIGLGDAAAMAKAARNWSHAEVLKVKLGGEGDAERLEAIRAARQDVRLVVDANASWSLETLLAMAPVMQDLGVELVEQPLAVADDAALEGLSYPIPLAADESVQDLQDLEQVSRRYQVANIKLDKCGGLTRALQMVAASRAIGLEPMIGNMGGTALSIGPHFLAAQGCRWADLDGPGFLRADREPPLLYTAGHVVPTDPVWA